MENEAFGGELRAHREAERVARSFLAYYDSQPYWTWSPQVRRTATDMRKAYALAEAARARYGGEAAASPPPVKAEGGGDSGGLTADESRLLTYYATLPPAARAAMLTELEALSRQAAAGGEVRTPALLGVAAAGEEGGGRA